MGHANTAHFIKALMKCHRIWRCQRTGNFRARCANAKGADGSRHIAKDRPELFGKDRGRCLAVGAGDRRDVCGLLTIETRSKLGITLARVFHRDQRNGGGCRSWRAILCKDGCGTKLDRIFNILGPVITRTGQGGKHIAVLYSA